MLNYQIEGDGPALLLVHGFGVSYPIWTALAPLLREHFKLVMVELPGIGQSPLATPPPAYYAECAAALVEVREAVGVERWAVLSYSSGTRAAEAYIQRDAAHITRAVFLCPAYVSRLKALGLRLGVRLDQRWPRFGSWALTNWRMHLLIIGLAFSGRRHPMTRVWNREINHQPMASLKATLRELPGAGGAQFDLPKLPTLFVWGRYDLLGSPPRRLRVNDRVIRADHSAPVMAAPKVAEVVIPFLKEPVRVNVC